MRRCGRTQLSCPSSRRRSSARWRRWTDTRPAWHACGARGPGEGPAVPRSLGAAPRLVCPAPEREAHHSNSRDHEPTCSRGRPQQPLLPTSNPRASLVPSACVAAPPGLSPAPGQAQAGAGPCRLYLSLSAFNMPSLACHCVNPAASTEALLRLPPAASSAGRDPPF